MPKTPVLIAARNEADRIKFCLNSLNPYLTAPIVVVNDCHDNTAEVARSTGATVIETDIPGKLHAIQLGLGRMGAAAFGNVLYTDADTRPLSRHWSTAMIRGLGDNTVGSGLFISTDRDPFGSVAISSLRLGNAIMKIVHHESYCSGANMITHFKNEANLNTVLSLDPFSDTPEDVARTECFPAHKIKAIVSPFAVVQTSSEHLPSVADAVRQGREATLKRVRRDRLHRGI